MGIIIALAVNAAIWGIGYLWRKYGAEKPGAPNGGIPDIPRVEDGAEIPLAWGRVLIKSPVIVWAGNKSSSQVNDFTWKFRASLHYYLCHTNRVIGADQGNAAKLVRVWFGELGADSFLALPTQQRTHRQAFQVRKGLGGEGQGGRAVGEVEFLPGAWDADLGTAAGTGGDNANLLYRMVQDGFDVNSIPDHQGAVSMFLHSSEPGSNGFEWGESPVLPTVWAEIVNPVAIPGVAASLMEIGEGDANPAGVLYDLVVNDEGGRLGYAASDVDATSFATAATTLKNEGNGFSYVAYRGTDVQRIIEMVLRQIDGVLYEDPTTGKWTLKLVREDYTLSDTDLLTEDSIVRVVDHEVVCWHDTANTIRVRYFARRATRQVGGSSVSGYVYDWRVAEQMDQSAAATKALVDAVTIEYPGVTVAAQAALICARDLRALGQPLLKMQVQVGREAFFWEPMRVIRVQHPRWQNRVLVMRVVKVDLGDTASNTITLDLLQDKWAVNYTIQTPPDVVTVFPDEAVRVRYWLGEEAPRFYLNRAQALGLGDVDSQRAWYLAEQPDDDDEYKGSYDDSTGDYVDTQARPFLGTFKVETAYARTTSAYDTTVGLRVKALNGWTPTTATDAQVRQYGQNVLYINGEFLAYLNYTDLGSGTYNLTNVYRGLADTTPQDHAVDDKGWHLSKTYAPRLIGLVGFEYGDAVELQVLGVNDGQVEDVDDAAVPVEVTVTTRTMRPYPVADLKVGSNLAAVSKTPALMSHDGVSMTWNRRSRLNTELLKGSDADETPPDTNTTFAVVVHKDSDEETGFYPHLAATGLTGTSLSFQSLASAGHGDVFVGLRTRYPKVIGGATVTLDSWMDALLPLTMPEWRNLLTNPYMHDGTNPSGSAWVETSNDLVPTNSGPWEPSAYATGDGTDTSNAWKQDVLVTSWVPKRMRVILDFYVKALSSDADDTVRVDLVTTNGTTDQDTQTYGPSIPTANWVRQTLNIAAADVDTTTLSVRGVQAAVGGGDTTLSAIVGGLQLRMGQISDQLLSNPTFDSGLTSWTTSLGGWSALSATPFIGANYIGGNGANATQELYQQVSIPAGFNYGYALCSVLMRTTPTKNTTAHLTVEARDGGGAVVATKTVNATADTVNKRLEAACDVPGTAATIRVYLKSTRDSGTANETEFDDVDLRIHKYLDPETSLELEFRPPAQDLPTRRQDWERLFPAVTVPMAVFTGAGGGLGTEPDVDVESGAFANSKLPLLSSDGDVTVSAYEFKRGSGGAVRVRASDFGNFSSSQSFTVRVVCSVQENSTGFTACGLVGHTNGTLGWKLELTATGAAKATLFGATSTKTVTSSYTGLTGVRWFGLSYDAGTNTLRVYTTAGENSVSTAGMGDIAVASVNTYIGGTSSGADTFTGLVARVEVWDSYVTWTSLASTWNHAEDTAGIDDLGFSYLEKGPQNGGTVACVQGEDADGVLVGWFGDSQIPHAWVGGEHGLALASGRINLANWDLTSSAIRVATTATEVVNDKIDPSGRLRASKLTGANTTYMSVQGGTWSASATVNVVFFARADVAHTMRVAITSSADVVKETIDVAVTTTWQRYDVKFTAWDGATATGRVRFIPSNDGTSRTVHVGGPWYVDQATGNRVPVLLHVGGNDARCYLGLEGLDPTVQFNHEGEVVVDVVAPNATSADACIVDLNDDATSNDRRKLGVTLDAATFAHYDSAGTGITSETSTLTWTTRRTIRGRWNRAGLLDAASAFAGVRTDASSDYDRTSVWTAGSPAPSFMDVGHAGGAEMFDGVVYKITLQARERIL